MHVCWKCMIFWKVIITIPHVAKDERVVWVTSTVYQIFDNSFLWEVYSLYLLEDWMAKDQIESNNILSPKLEASRSTNMMFNNNLGLHCLVGWNRFILPHSIEEIIFTFTIFPIKWHRIKNFVKLAVVLQSFSNPTYVLLNWYQFMSFYFSSNLLSGYYINLSISGNQDI